MRARQQHSKRKAHIAGAKTAICRDAQFLAEITRAPLHVARCTLHVARCTRQTLPFHAVAPCAARSCGCGRALRRSRTSLRHAGDRGNPHLALCASGERRHLGEQRGKSSSKSLMRKLAMSMEKFTPMIGVRAAAAPAPSQRSDRPRNCSIIRRSRLVGRPRPRSRVTSTGRACGGGNGGVSST